ncbi:hypothetical protein TSUD_385840 [Trifolium subterraneum]|uniref:Uncharacterized protein n=1 Tax=Trifolium subterraneum TaxID=3900 RepID=A0A2Z6MK31_TRISU|nr:hypothetical protein TSUD_385840 [Trifolium subterraneum]
MAPETCHHPKEVEATSYAGVKLGGETRCGGEERQHATGRDIRPTQCKKLCNEHISTDMVT